MNVNRQFKLTVISFSLFFLSGFSLLSNAATSIKSSNEIIKVVSSQLQTTHFAKEEEKFKFNELNRSLDNNHTLHVRLQQTYLNYPVFGGDVILHYPNSTNINASINSLLNNKQLSINGKLYLALKKELPMMPLSNVRDLK